MCTHNNAHRSGRRHDRSGTWVVASRGNCKTEQIHDYSVAKGELNKEPLYSTPMHVIDGMLKVLYPRKDDYLCDLGCGDGRICIEAAKTYGCSALGIEKDRELVFKARQNVADAGLTHKICIREADILDTGLVYPTMYIMYLYSDLMEKVLPRIQQDSVHTIASIHHELEDKTLKFTVRDTPVYMKRNIV